MALVALGSAGCVMLAATAVGGGAVGVAYLNGKVTDTFDASVDATAIATRSALQNLALPLEWQNVGRTHGEIDSRTGTDRQIQIDLDAVPSKVPADPQQTKVGIRVVAFGDEALSKRILEHIQFRLRTPAPVSAGTAPSFAPLPHVVPPSPLPPPPPPAPSQTEEPPLAGAPAGK